MIWFLEGLCLTLLLINTLPPAKGPGTVRRPHRFAISGGILALLGGISGFGKGWFLFAAAGLLLSGAVLILTGKSVLRYDEAGFSPWHLFGKKQHSYKALWGIEKEKFLYLEQGRLRLYRTNDCTAFLEFAQRRYQSSHGGHRIPKVSSIPRRYDPFRGNIREPWAHFLLLLLVFLLLTGGMIAAVLLLWGTREAFLMIGIWFLFVLPLFTGTFLAGRYAERLPPPLRRLCWRDSFLHW